MAMMPNSARSARRALTASTRFGFTILVDEASLIIAGHGSLLAAETLNLPTVPVMVTAGWAEAEKRAYLIADNQLALDAGWDADLLREELDYLQTTDLDVLGFPETTSR
ncbi:hypothetical protein [Bradyrhizobium sp. CB3481]|uniref:hypothetical protein n=1 Tax=Bradyrhizobium sp. CB3481 TaxID=3039158 RepID=UPI0024B116F5|nr:hypothetical protein [Bradyrhizobium sp. CB3481]WFU19444.1 hypothetical protein QA643_14490 [Bradyrhizobium sp. CB3481]